MSEDLAARVRARLDEIAAAAEAARDFPYEIPEDAPWWVAQKYGRTTWERHIALHDPAAVLADVASKREILAYAERVFANAKEHPDDFASKGAFLAMHGVVRRLAEGLGLSDE